MSSIEQHTELTEIQAEITALDTELSELLSTLDKPVKGNKPRALRLGEIIARAGELTGLKRDAQGVQVTIEKYAEQVAKTERAKLIKGKAQDIVNRVQELQRRAVAVQQQYSGFNSLEQKFFRDCTNAGVKGDYLNRVAAQARENARAEIAEMFGDETA